MKHNIRISGYSYKLRPVEIDDADFIVDVRLENEEKSKYIHKISSDTEKQKEWLKQYFEREGDYYFVIENLFTKEKEGLISIYNIDNNKAEWGRWVLKSCSLAAFESVYLIYKTAFEKLQLNELYTKTVENNATVVDFHKNINAKFRAILKNEFELEGNLYNAVEQYVDKEHFYSNIEPELNKKCQKLFERNMRQCVGKFKFHHFGVATENIERAFEKYKNYERKDYFKDDIQGVRGLFINSKDEPVLELLENLPNSHTLDIYIQNNIEIYHIGYLTNDIQKAYNILVEKLCAKVISEMKISEYFKKRICFIMLKNKQLIELIEC